jgi:hypothetical protein
MTADKDFMLNNPQFVLKNNTIIQVDMKNIKNMYWSAIAAKVIDRRIILLEHLILKNN